MRLMHVCNACTAAVACNFSFPTAALGTHKMIQTNSLLPLPAALALPVGKAPCNHMSAAHMQETGSKRVCDAGA